MPPSTAVRLADFRSVARSRRYSRIVEPTHRLGNVGPDPYLYFAIGNAADGVPDWGTSVVTRDAALRRFWPTEPLLASAIYSTVGRYAALGWSMAGPPQTVKVQQEMLANVEGGRGWTTLITKLLLDLFTQDNGGFWEWVRTADDADAPIVSINHLDAARCRRTGDSEVPVIYFDHQGRGHDMKWYQVETFEEFASPIEHVYNIQYCALTRLLRAAQIMRDISVYEREKISGRFSKALHLVGGVTAKAMKDAQAAQQEAATGQGLTRYIQPIIVASLDPTTSVSTKTIELASLPDGFDKEAAFKEYIATMAMAFGGDYQDYAPLPGGNLGSSQQSETLSQKSRGKGPALFRAIMQQKMNNKGAMPRSVQFDIGENEIEVRLQRAELEIKESQVLSVQISSGVLSPRVARQIAVDKGMLDPRYLDLLKEDDAIAMSVLESSENPNAQTGAGSVAAQSGSQQTTQPKPRPKPGDLNNPSTDDAPNRGRQSTNNQTNKRPTASPKQVVASSRRGGTST